MTHIFFIFLISLISPSVNPFVELHKKIGICDIYAYDDIDKASA